MIQVIELKECLKLVQIRFFEFFIMLLTLVLCTQFFLPSTIRKWSKNLIVGLISILGFIFFVLHVFLEGIRWQMVLIYLFSILIFGWGVYKLTKWYRSPSSDLSVKEPIKKVRGVISIIVVFLVIISTILISFQFPMFTIPDPTGDYHIGTTKFLLTDNSREEIFTDDPGDFRNIIIRVWYPADTPTGSPMRYVDSPSQFGKGIERSFGFPSFVVSHFSLISTHSYPNAPISQNQANFPVIIFPMAMGD